MSSQALNRRINAVKSRIPVTVKPEEEAALKYIKIDKWRKRRDSNPRDGSPPTPLAGERLRPLGHVSANWFNYLFR